MNKTVIISHGVCGSSLAEPGLSHRKADVADARAFRMTHSRIVPWPWVLAGGLRSLASGSSLGLLQGLHRMAAGFPQTEWSNKAKQEPLHLMIWSRNHLDHTVISAVHTGYTGQLSWLRERTHRAGISGGGGHRSHHGATGEPAQPQTAGHSGHWEGVQAGRGCIKSFSELPENDCQEISLLITQYVLKQTCSTSLKFRLLFFQPGVTTLWQISRAHQDPCPLHFPSPHGEGGPRGSGQWAVREGNVNDLQAEALEKSMYYFSITFPYRTNEDLHPKQHHCNVGVIWLCCQVTVKMNHLTKSPGTPVNLICAKNKPLYY